MKLIAHRGLVDGPDKAFENHPKRIKLSLEQGFDCEVDLRVVNGELYLGHDEPQYKIDESFLKTPGLWIHCKNTEALEFCYDDIKLNYFWHDTDDYTITSRGWVWTYPGKVVPKWGIAVMPEWNDPTLSSEMLLKYNGICSDFVAKIQHLIVDRDK